MSDRLASLRYLGPVTIERLVSVGVTDPSRLEALGSVESYRRLRRAYPDETSLNALWALHGAIVDLDWRDLPDGLKDELARQVDA